VSTYRQRVLIILISPSQLFRYKLTVQYYFITSQRCCKSTHIHVCVALSYCSDKHHKNAWRIYTRL